MQETKKSCLRRRRKCFGFRKVYVNEYLAGNETLISAPQAKIFFNVSEFIKIAIRSLHEKREFAFLKKNLKTLPPPQKFQNSGGGIIHFFLRGGVLN